MWTKKSYNTSAIDNLASSANISPIIAKLLINRGITTAEAAMSFLNPAYIPLPHEPQFIISVERIASAIKNKEKILIHGDYDADGITSIIIMLKTIQLFGGDVDFFVPHRLLHGYGFNSAGLNYALEIGAKVIMTIDCGFSSQDTVKCAFVSGIDDIIILDHHKIDKKLPDTPYIVSGQLLPEDSYHHHLCGAGLAFMFASMLAEALGRPKEGIDNLIEIAALGTIGDMVPLVGINRWIVSKGLKKIKQAPGLGIETLMKIKKINPETLTAENLAFYLVPLINASSRMEDAGIAINLFLTDNPDSAAQYAENLNKLNEERQALQRTMCESAKIVAEQRTTDCIIITGEYPAGIAGLVASDLCKHFGKPAIVLGEDGLKYKGSARSIPGFDIHGALVHCEQYFKDSGHFGGHVMAAGLSILKENFPSFKIAFDDFFKQQVLPDPVTMIDDEIHISDITTKLIKNIEDIGPFGEGNPKPLFVIRACQMKNIKKMGAVEKGHFSTNIQRGGDSAFAPVRAVAWRLAEKIPEQVWKDRILSNLDVLAQLELNTWNGITTPQITIRDFKTFHSGNITEVTIIDSDDPIDAKGIQKNKRKPLQELSETTKTLTTASKGLTGKEKEQMSLF